MNILLDEYQNDTLMPDVELIEKRNDVMKWKQYWVCPFCHSNLDFGEKCDCQKEVEQEKRRKEELYKQEAGSDQFTFNWFPEGLEA